MAGGDLNVTKRHASVQGGGDEAVPQRVGGDVLADAGPSGQAPNDAGDAMAVEALSGPGHQDGTTQALAGGQVH